MADRIVGCFVGLCAVDLFYVVDHFPGPNQKIKALRQDLMAGGPAANAAVTFSYLGGEARLITSLGEHPLASVAREDLKRNRIEIHDLAEDRAGLPAISSVCVHQSSGERSVVSANAPAQPAALSEFSSELLSGVRVLLVDGHHMAVCIAAAEAAQARRIPVVLDGGSWKDGMADLLALVDIAICSEDFLPRPDAKTASKVAITRGEKPILWFAGESSGEIAVKKIQAIDTTGAGDIFHGAFCWEFARGSSFAQALEFAAGVASESCLHYGTRAWMRS